METIGPATRRNATGPLRRLIFRREVPRPPVRRRLSVYGVPIGLLALIGLGLAAAAYLSASRALVPVAVALIAIGSVLPAALTYRRPVLAWRVSFVMLFAGVANAAPAEAWPWNPVQILVSLVVLARFAVTQESALTVWATVLTLLPVFGYASVANGWGGAVALVAVAAVGNIFFRRRHVTELLAGQEELTELERAKRAVLEERTRIAREMHDVVAHHMSMIAVRAETAPYRLTGLPDDARAELATIATAARAALTDMRRLLGVLRSPDGEEATRAPQPGLADIAGLVATARAAGVDVTCELSEVDGLPETTGLTAYRIVQEALANAARHAPDGPVRIEGRGFADRLELSVRNRRTRPPGEKGGGHGLIGMRERAELLGGSLSAGPDGADFLVRATLPVEEPA